MRVLVVDDSETVRRVMVRTLSRAGYETTEAEDGRVALERVQKETPDLVIVDDVMPYMDGVSFIEAMRSVQNVSHVPVVIMSARGALLGDELMRKTGAVDAISKPFAPEALLAVTANALDKGRRTPPLGGAYSSPEAWLSADTSEEPSTLAAEAERAAAARRMAGRITMAIGDAVRAAVGAPVDDAGLAAAIAGAVSTERLFRLSDELRAQLPGESGELSFRGRLDHVGLGEVLQMLQHQRQTGVLSARRDERAIEICLREGMLDLAVGHAHGREFLLGRYVLGEGLIEPEDLAALLKRRGGQEKLLGAQLVKLGYMSQGDLTRVLVRQSSELIYEAMRWPDGVFGFERFATRPEATAARLGLPVAAILMEGLRRVDEWRLIEEQIKSFDIVPVIRRDILETVSLDDLDGGERRVLEAIDGERTVRQIVVLTRMSLFDVGKVLFQLVMSGLVHER
jgi:DNA-binding response OmpR family regulator